MEFKVIRVIARSQYGIVAQPIDAEAYERPVKIILECRELAFDTNIPVTLLDKNGERCVFRPPVLK